MLCGIEDPFNFGCAVRSFYAAGASGFIVSPRNWMSAAGVVCRSSAGASELLPLYISESDEALNFFKEKKIKIAKLFGLNVKDLIEELREKSEFKRSYKLPMAEKIINELNELEVDFIISPDLINKYPHLIGCKSF